MQAKKFVVPKINLLPKDPFYDTPVGKFSLWAVQIGRYIIVFTEIIVIMSFATRFKLDRDVTNLNSSIVQKKAIVESFGDTEVKSRALQKQIASLQKILKGTSAVVAMQRIAQHIPNGIEFSRYSYDSTQLSIEGKASSSNLFASMILALQNQKDVFHSVSIEKILSGQGNDPSVTFTVRVGLLGAKEEESYDASQELDQFADTTENQL